VNQRAQLRSFGDNLNVAVVGGTGGIGAALVDQLSDCPFVDTVLVLSRIERSSPNPRHKSITIDLEDEDGIARAALAAKNAVETLSLVIVATGLLHDGAGFQPERSWKELSPDSLLRAFQVNAFGPLLVAKHFLPLLDKNRKSVFAALSARVGSIEDNRLGGWYAYRSSKAALNMFIRTLSIELSRRNSNGICVGLHPGTVDTTLSKPFQRNVPLNDLKSPAQSAGQLLDVLDVLSPEDTGAVFAWDGQRIPF